MKKVRVYVETSVINHLDPPDRPDWMADTLELWAEFETGKYNLVVGAPVISEIKRCPEPKHGIMSKELNKLPYKLVDATAEAERITAEYIAAGGLPKKSWTDALHIALAVLSKCDVIVSWNFSHIVNLKAMTAVDEVNAREGLKRIQIVPPPALLGGIWT